LRAEVQAYKQYLEEEIRDYSTAKFYFRNGRPFMVGALARVNLNFSQLADEAREAADKLGFKPPNHNSFHNNTAQLIEMVHCVSEVCRLLEEVSSGLRDENPPEVKVRGGRGVGSVEAPRGTLIHCYELGGDGLLREVDIVTPTALSLNNVEADMLALVKQHAGEGGERVASLVEALIRSYDPCISCSVHLVKA